MEENEETEAPVERPIVGELDIAALDLHERQILFVVPGEMVESPQQIRQLSRGVQNQINDHFGYEIEPISGPPDFPELGLPRKPKVAVIVLPPGTWVGAAAIEALSDEAITAIERRLVRNGLPHRTITPEL